MKTKKEVAELTEYYNNLGVKYTYVNKTYSEKERAFASEGSRFKKDYGITADDYNYMLDVQDGKCAICGQKETTKSKDKYGDYTTKRLAVDHCHATGKVRGLLCRRCNMAIGLFKDSEENLEKAQNYLRLSRVNF